MNELKVNASRDQIEELKESTVWNDITRELNSWKKGFNSEILSIVDDAESNNPSTASVLLHMGDLNGRQKAVDYMLSILDVFIDIIETQKENKDGEEEID